MHIQMTMNHAEIEERNVVARYERDALPQDERETFEEHLVDCPECQDAVDAEGELRRGLRAVLPPARSRRTFWRYLNVAALVLLAVSVAVLALQLRSAREEVRALAVRRAPVPVVRATPSLAGAAMLVSLDRVRGSESPNPLTLPPTPQVVVLSVSRGDSTFAAYRLRLVHDGSPVAQTPQLAPSDTFALAVPSASLPPGEYKLMVEGLDGSAWRPSTQYDLQVRAGG